MTLLPRLASKSQAKLILCIAERLPKGQGWKIHTLPASSQLTHENSEIAVRAVNIDVERCVEICPTQYLWCYKRFNTRPELHPPVY